MNFIPRRVQRAIAAWIAKRVPMPLSSVDSGRGWYSIFSNDGDWQMGAWQQDSQLSNENIIGFAPVYAGLTLIASDVGKVCLRLMHEQEKVWVETTSPSFSPVLRKPNHYQTRQQFIECWVLSKLLHGNTYVLKVRDNRNVVTAMHVLDPCRVTPLVAPDSSVFYALDRDDLSGLFVDFPAVPAREVIHDRMECLFHPLVGISPLFASRMPSTQGIRIQRNSEQFFKNMSRPSGILTAPGTIDDETANRLKEDFEKNFSGEKMGRTLVGGDGLQYNPFAFPAEQSQLVEQLKLSAEQVCMTLHVPAYMIGAGPLPSYNNIEALTQQYYQQCLQKLFEAIEDLLDDGLGITAAGYRTEFDLDELFRMDTATRMDSVNKAIAGGWMAPNEGRARFGMLPVTGGESPMMQQQNWNLEQLAEREAPSDTGTTAGPPAPTEDDDTEDIERALIAHAKTMPPLGVRLHG